MKNFFKSRRSNSDIFFHFNNRINEGNKKTNYNLLKLFFFQFDKSLHIYIYKFHINTYIINNLSK
jgi:hypothetical protein